MSDTIADAVDKAKHDGLPVKGYQPQTQGAVDLVNSNKITEEQLLRTLDVYAAGDMIDKRWLAVARTHFEQGFMALNRSVFRPGRVRLPEDK
jgi:hypothetical protein